jgi:hypothetical protein
MDKVSGGEVVIHENSSKAGSGSFLEDFGASFIGDQEPNLDLSQISIPNGTE